MTWPQVKVSSGVPEVDFFIHKRTWNDLGLSGQNTIKEKLLEIFDRLKKPGQPLKLDVYQEISPYSWEPDLWRANLLDRRYPQIEPPAGALILGSDGTIIHELLGGLQ